MRPESVLVTGASGFLASALAPLLRRRFPKARLTLASRRPRRGFVALDLAAPGTAAALVRKARPDLVFHLAGGRPSRDLPAMGRDHVAATRALGEALHRHAPGARLVVAGSSAEYGRTPPRRVTEDLPTRPLTPYGRVKRDQSKAALSFARRGLDVRVARIFNVCGPATPESLAPGAFAAQVAALERRGGGTVRVGDLRPGRDFIDVRDCAQALLLLGTADGLSGCYNVCSGTSTPMASVLRLLVRAARAPVKIEPDPARMRAAEVQNIRGSHARLTRATGWRPRVPLARSLADTLAWHRSR